MKLIRALIIDDEPLARENIAMRLEKDRDFEICGQADNGHDALVLALKTNPDVIFLDIDMPGLSGIEAAKKLYGNKKTMIIFVTAYDQHAIEAFQIRALDYLLKPINDDLFLDTLDRIKNSKKQPVDVKSHSNYIHPIQGYLKRLSIKENKKISMIDVSTIETIELAGDYLCITSKQENFIHRQALKSLLKLLDPNIFARIHRSHAINLDFLDTIVEEVSGHYALMLNGQRLSISRRYLKNFKNKINKT